MKRFILVMVAVLLAAVCLAASAEEEPRSRVACSDEDGQLMIRVIRKADDPGTWEADEPEGDDSVVTLRASDATDSEATFVFAPVKDGWQVIEIYHTVGPVCDEYYQFVVEVVNGGVTGWEAGDHVTSPDDALLDPFLIGEWVDVDNPSRTLTVTDNDTSGWNLEVVRADDNAYRFTGSVLFDCDEDVLVYTDGAVYNLPADGEEATAVMENQLGLMLCDVTDVEDGELVLIWEDPATGEVVFFMRSDENAPNILAPEVVDLDTEDGLLPDGIYWANIDPDALRSGSLEKTIFCVVDVYSGVDIREIDAGEMLVREYKMYWIDGMNEDGTLQFRDASTEITGTVNFVNIPGSDDYVAMDAESDSPMLTSVDVTEMPLDGAAEMTVVTGESLEAAAVDAAGMADALASGAGTTLVVVRDGRVREIRCYRDVPVAGMMADVRSGSSDQ